MRLDKRMTLTADYAGDRLGLGEGERPTLRADSVTRNRASSSGTSSTPKPSSSILARSAGEGGEPARDVDMRPAEVDGSKSEVA